MNKYFVSLLLYAFIINQHSHVKAQTFQIVNRQGTDALTNAVLDQIEIQANRELPNVNGDRYAQGNANSNNQSMKGLGSDYANDIDLFIVSSNVGFGIDTNNSSDIFDFDFDENEVRGFGINQTFTVGTNLGLFRKKSIGFVDPSRVDLFLNYSHARTRSSDLTKGYSAKNQNIGFHMRYHFFEGQSLFSTFFLKWGGLYLTTGLESTSSKLALFQKINESREESGASALFDGTATISADSTIFSIPIEISSYIQAFYILSLYGGLGVDINFGGADINARVDGNITLTGNSVGTADAILNLSGSGDVNSVTARAFLGAQVNLSVLKIYAQVGKQIGNNISSGHAGIKFTW